MEELNQMDKFFKTSSFITSKDSLVLQGVAFERLYFDYYSEMINSFKKFVPLSIPQNRSLKKSSWEPLLQAIHHGCLLSFNHFLPVIDNRTESGILMDLFHILQQAGFGTFELSLPVPGSIMSISVKHSLDSYSDMTLGLEAENTLSVFTGGVVLSCFNLAMSSIPALELNDEKAEQIYMNSPDIIQVNHDGGDTEVIFALSIS
jgi:hypothetical protein